MGHVNLCEYLNSVWGSRGKARGCACRTRESRNVGQGNMWRCADAWGAGMSGKGARGDVCGCAHIEGIMERNKINNISKKVQERKAGSSLWGARLT
jgi:hypothetical protein